MAASGATHHDQFRWVLLELFGRFLDSLAFVSGLITLRNELF
jgi:hypothetical protein